ncbi:TRAP-type C4-dicarboxylate transport system permease small subunit [Ureibacillus xyleni]|uniref:TRAP-type C4-dicarboxylate transport system permease small subunit n=1 Tax=Ureibacillus xyleni TaxID=614648 RepID=A0A285SSX2_9BACL|nr:TRAP transporter small permease [Ureibacillus xyleni]SOC11615.1 TRAP-type C4-dicarboxylate transport system permease small subunit [Ureibacillus xyleni]
MKGINKLSDIVFSIEKVLAILLATVLLVSLAAGVLFRTLKSPLFWSDELAIFCLIWITFIGGSMGLKQNASPSITIVTDLLPQKAKKIVLALSNFILLVFIGYVLYLAFQWINMPNIMIQTSTAMNMPKLYFYLSIPVSFVFMVIHVLNNVLLSFKAVDEAGDLS